ncbi:FMN-binding protein [Haloimpatiens lingqiaonensis]|uniref:FMN-binding protein n=1 Tax=Haloimpatiens lingqiaonensis TaxID=1380675 RepID=UPI0010FD14B7|nr:FMN-binding protein [Haloimpatiens lingqiaonensis]
MRLFLNIGFAKMCTILGILASIIYMLRIANKNLFNNKNQILTQINRFLRKHHILIGVLVVTTGLIHGLYSSDPVLSLNLGTICWVFSILLGLNWALRKKLKSWIVFHRLLTLGFLITLALHILSVKGFLFNSDKGKFHRNNTVNISEEYSDKDNSNINSTNSNTGTAKGQYKDGVYQGVGNGYRRDLTVEVTIKNGKISRVDIVSDNETPKFSRIPFETIPEEIVNAQSTEVDLVSGATMTSRGVIEAVNDALSKAGK